MAKVKETDLMQDEKPKVENIFGKRFEELTPEDFAHVDLRTRKDYYQYNEAVKYIRKKFKKEFLKGDLDLPFVYIPHDLLETHKIKFQRREKPSNKPTSFNFKLMDCWVKFYETLDPGNEYVLPKEVINEINRLGRPTYKQVKYPDGTYETVLDKYEPRFSCQAVF